MGFHDGSNSKESACNATDMGSIPESGRSPGGGHGNPFQCSCLENPMDRDRVPQIQTQLKQFSMQSN